MSSAQAASYLGITQTRVNQLVATGKLTRYKVGGYNVYRRADLDRWRDAPKAIGGRPPGARNKPKKARPDQAAA
jgi:excisionase family DNA binding protein